jgi:hypothetical protein
MPIGNIFISYRRDDTPGHAGRIYDRLNARYPNRVFMDVTGIGLGDDFVVAIEQQVIACRVFIAIIGSQWASITDQAGRRRLEQPEDFVRLEVAAALKRQITIIPVLVRGARMPDPSTLPADIAFLTRRNALEITENDFNHDVARLIDRLETIFKRPIGEPTIYQTDPGTESWYRRLQAWLHGRLAWRLGLVVAGLLLMGAIGLFVSLHNFGPQPNWNENNGNNGFNRKTASPEPSGFVPPTHSARFVNSKEGLSGALAEHYVDFSFYYPRTWVVDTKAGVAGARNFVKVDRILDSNPELTQENFTVGWYHSGGSPATEFPALAENLSSQIKRTVPEYAKTWEGPTKVNSLEGYEFRFEGLSRNTPRGDIRMWGRVMFVPPQDGSTNGVTIVMLATSLAPEIRSENDVGLKGEAPVILKSFQFGAPR